ncbi:MAG: DUF4375 domain-containing protein [Armatimonadetes bacterium]|nr:DUF4375 domain-containing protein [Armatimonadota bacterium]
MLSRAEWDRLLKSGSDVDLIGVFSELPEDNMIGFVLYADGEICNGGFFQYYSNGIFSAREHIHHLQQLGLNQLADVVQQTLNLFPDSVQPVRLESDLVPIDDRILQLLGDRSCLDNLNIDYFEVNGTNSKGPTLVEVACAKHIRDHADEYWDLLEAGY